VRNDDILCTSDGYEKCSVGKYFEEIVDDENNTPGGNGILNIGRILLLTRLRSLGTLHLRSATLLLPFRLTLPQKVEHEKFKIPPLKINRGSKPFRKNALPEPVK